MPFEIVSQCCTSLLVSLFVQSEFKEKLRGVSERYDKSQKESTEKLKAVEEKVNITNQKFEELVNDKHELETRAQVMQSRIASLLTTMEELKRSKVCILFSI